MPAAASSLHLPRECLMKVRAKLSAVFCPHCECLLHFHSAANAAVYVQSRVTELQFIHFAIVAKSFL